MEFKNVHIINCSEENIPHFRNLSSNIEEERRLFYVAVTRTINNLYIYSCRNLKGKLRTPSRFIEECGINNLISESSSFNIGDTVTHKYFGDGRIQSVKDDVIEIVFKNDISRKFNLDILISNDLIDIV
jgi:DNA helicase II / ATP-dependent DNA helicase PcrA